LGNFDILFQIFLGKKKGLLPMPRPSKKSAQAQLQRLAGSKSFGPAQATGSNSNTGSIYSLESEDSASLGRENDITALQTLYTNILPESL
jgi:hypothetical protein